MKNFLTKAGLLSALLLLIGSYVFAQAPDPFVMTDFEPGTPAGSLTTDPPGPPGWNKNGTNVPQIVANPDKSGINVSNTVMFCVRNVGDEAWVGPKIDDAEWGSVFANTWGGPITGYSYMHIKMYCNQVVKPGINLQVEEGDVGAPTAGTVITPNTWVDVVFDISQYTELNRIIIMIDQTNSLTQASEVYLDDIMLSNDPTPIAIKPDPFVMTDFEPGTPAGSLTTDPPGPPGWNKNGTNVPQIVSNPDKSGINVSNTVMFCVRNVGNVAWVGPKIDDAEWGTVFADTWGGPITGYSYMHIKMYCNKAISPHVNVQAGGSEPGPMSGGMVTTTNAWVDVVFNISDCSAVERILIMFDSTDQDSEVYLDDIILSNDPTPITDGMLTKVNNIVGGTDVSVFAVNGTLHISGSSDAVAVYSALGQLVYQNKPAENLSVELAKGLYIVKAGAVIQKILIQ